MKKVLLTGGSGFIGRHKIKLVTSIVKCTSQAPERIKTNVMMLLRNLSIMKVTIFL